jgi:hypothetical protein
MRPGARKLAVGPSLAGGVHARPDCAKDNLLSKDNAQTYRIAGAIPLERLLNVSPRGEWFGFDYVQCAAGAKNGSTTTNVLVNSTSSKFGLDFYLLKSVK